MLSFKGHCWVGFLIRTLMIFYGVIQDDISEVKYTDVDYKVFTDAANHVLRGNSPFDRYTYRYSPLLAYLMIPNIVLHWVWGKFFFSVCDIVICLFIRRLLKIDKVKECTILWCTAFWLYNPLTIVISTRGNADSVSSLLVLATLLMMKTKSYILAGILHGISIHFRIYPLAFSLCMYLSITYSKKHVNKFSIINFFKIIAPTFDRLKLVISCVLTLISITSIFYLLYGYTFLFESFLYHLHRHDIRHNFSVYFYLEYLSSVSNISSLQRVLTVLPQLILLVTISFVYSKTNHMYFAQLLIAFIMVAFNTVLTCQYFIWFLCLIPLVIPKLKMSVKTSLFLFALFGAGQLAWLLPAYLLEFKNWNTFIYIWFQGLMFFCINIFCISRLIVNYNMHVKYD